MPWLLAIDTCGGEGGVALAQTESCTVVSARTLPGRETQERLMTAVQEVLSEASVTPADLGYIAVTHGPGSFTGVRIGIAAAKGLAEALHLPIVAESRLKLLALRAGSKEAVNAWLDAGRGDVYAGIYRGAACISEGMYTREAARQLEGEIITGEEQLREEGRFVGAPAVQDLVHAACEDIRAGRLADVLTLDANYLRIPDAELALRARL